MTKRKTPGSGDPETPPGRDGGRPATLTPAVTPLAVPVSIVPIDEVSSAPLRRPMARATRITVFEREVRERLSRAALDVMFARAESMSEGQCSARGGREVYFGSTMLTIDLATLADVLRDASEPGTPPRLVALMEVDKDVPARIRELAAREATRIAVKKLRELTTHVSIRSQGSKVFIDVDVEASA